MALRCRLPRALLPPAISVPLPFGPVPLPLPFLHIPVTPHITGLLSGIR